jgi:hypothetical protein
MLSWVTTRWRTDMTATYSSRLTGIETSVAVKAPVRAATTADITLSGEQSVDGIALVDGDRVLVKDQTAASENGIYVVSTGAWARARDFDGSSEISHGTLTYVTQGSTLSNTLWALNTATPSIGSALPFIQLLFSGSLPLDGLVVEALGDPGADRLVGWRESADTTIYYTLGAGLEFDGTEVRITATSFAQTLLDDDDAAMARATLGLGSAATLAAGTSASNLVQLDGSGQLPAVDGSQLTGMSGALLARCAFDGTGSTPLSVEANGLNVTDVTKNGTGDYTINFTDDLAHANYSVHGMAVDTGSDLNSAIAFQSSSARSVSSVRVINVDRSGALRDSALITVSVFG